MAKVLITPPQSFSTKIHMFGPAHKSDHDGIVRTFAWHCKVVKSYIYLFK